MITHSRDALAASALLFHSFSDFLAERLNLLFSSIVGLEDGEIGKLDLDSLLSSTIEVIFTVDICWIRLRKIGR